MKKTLILGANDNPSRYAYMAAGMLKEYGHEFVPVGIKKGSVFGQQIQREFPQNKDIHTLTLYINPQVQKEYYTDIINLKPERIIFNPGTENDELIKLAEENGIQAVEGCTLVMLRSGQF